MIQQLGLEKTGGLYNTRRVSKWDFTRREESPIGTFNNGRSQQLALYTTGGVIN